MNKIENVTRSQIATPEEPLLQQGAGNLTMVLKLRVQQSLLEATRQALGGPDTSSNTIGTTSQALSAGGTTYLPNVGNMPYYEQQGNACGTTTLAEIMSYLGVPMTQADIDAVIRRGDV